MASAAADAGDGASQPTVNKLNRVKYACPCKKQVWGKPGLKLICGSCGDEFDPTS